MKTASVMKNGHYHLKVIVLAAGKSTRFNGIKVLAPVTRKAERLLAPQMQPEHGVSMIEQVLSQVSNALITLNIPIANLQVATGQYHAEINKLIGEKYSLIHCQDAHLGMGHTISNAVQSVCGNNDDISKNNAKIVGNNNLVSSHIMFALADQVALTTHDYIKLIQQSIKTPQHLICATSVQNSTLTSINNCVINTDTISPPAIFPQRYVNALMQLQGDKGARALLKANTGNLKMVLLPNANVDIDTTENLSTWLGENKQRKVFK